MILSDRPDHEQSSTRDNAIGAGPKGGASAIFRIETFIAVSAGGHVAHIPVDEPAPGSGLWITFDEGRLGEYRSVAAHATRAQALARLATAPRFDLEAAFVPNGSTLDAVVNASEHRTTADLPAWLVVLDATGDTNRLVVGKGEFNLVVEFAETLVATPHVPL